jgi:flagellar biogenesis protein FliO
MDNRANWHSRLNRTRGWMIVAALLIVAVAWLVKR